MASTSGVRGVIGHELTPELCARYGAAFGSWLREGSVVIGRDSRPSGEMLMRAVTAGLISVGTRVVDIGLAPTPTVEIAVSESGAAGGICVTASHNPAEWNALKFFNRRGEFLSPGEYEAFTAVLDSGKILHRGFASLGTYEYQEKWIKKHIKMVLGQPVVNKRAIRKRGFKVVVDCINGAGSTALPLLLDELGARVTKLNCDGSGDFVHDPEPVPKNLQQLCAAVMKKKADLGLACDPDADRLALVDETGTPIGEELTLAIAVKAVLVRLTGPTVINLSTSKATADIATMLGSTVHLAKVGEANVVEMMHRVGAVIGGEGNGGVILPGFHAGRDALVAAALVLTSLAEEKCTLGELAKSLPQYYAVKTKASLPADFKNRLERFTAEAARLLGPVEIDTRDGLRCDFAGGWAQIRSSNTEPIYRLIVETTDAATSERHAKSITKFFA